MLLHANRSGCCEHFICSFCEDKRNSCSGFRGVDSCLAIDAVNGVAYDAARAGLPRRTGRSVRLLQKGKMKRVLKIAVWTGIALLGAGALSAIALHRGEALNATWFVVAA